jgi:hypothetical protein
MILRLCGHSPDRPLLTQSRGFGATVAYFCPSENHPEEHYANQAQPQQLATSVELAAREIDQIVDKTATGEDVPVENED